MRVKFITLGCKVNQYETQGLSERFLSLGHQVTDGKADLYVINTCTVTKRADSKSKSAVLKARGENPKAKIAVCGCLAQLNRDFIEKLGVDYIISQDEKHLLPEIVLGLDNCKKSKEESGNSNFFKISSFYNHRAFVKIQDGCNNFCSFCKIPYLRGPSRSKDRDKALLEIKEVSKNHREIVLCGINLSLYGKDLNPSQNLEDFVEEALRIDSLERLRLSSLEPFYINEKLFSFLNNPKFCPHLHFPFQNGDDRILKAMNKKESTSLYEDIVKKARKIKPDVAISCDIMVGFPDEDEKSFNNTLGFIKRIRPMRMHIFSFSPRENTKFEKFKLKNQKLAKERSQKLQELADDFSLEYRKMFISKTLDMVVEEKDNGFLCGYTQNYIRVKIFEKVPLGNIVKVKIERVEKDNTFATLCG